MQPELLILYVLILVLSVIVHEVAHGYVADLLGDPTARYAGRLTLNPIPHIDPLGSIILPGLLLLTNTPLLIGWAKPVPVNPYNLSRGGRYAEAYVSAAGIAANLAIALFAGLSIRALAGAGMLSSEALDIASIVVLVNLSLALFNLLPIPPLDGSKLLASLVSLKAQTALRNFEMYTAQWGFLGMILFIYLLFTFVSPIFGVFVRYLFSLITGIGVG